MSIFSKPRDASTVVLMREPENRESGPFEVLLLLRSEESSFVPSNYVFPGGSVDDDDVSQALYDRCAGISPGSAADIMGPKVQERMALAFWIAAIRETFEETGLLLAYDRDGAMVSHDMDCHDAACFDYRARLWNNDITFARFLEERDLVLAAEQLRYFSHWVTPAFLPIRYSTRFFAARAPVGQKVFHDGREIVDFLWISPDDALAKSRKGKLDMVLPTVATLETLRDFSSIDEVMKKI
jgi:8-oxo-dGTP pyrophosphatase MutT (NUDIX family)